MENSEEGAKFNYHNEKQTEPPFKGEYQKQEDELLSDKLLSKTYSDLQFQRKIVQNVRQPEFEQKDNSKSDQTAGAAQVPDKIFDQHMSHPEMKHSFSQLKEHSTLLDQLRQPKIKYADSNNTYSQEQTVMREHEQVVYDEEAFEIKKKKKAKWEIERERNVFRKLKPKNSDKE